MIYLQQSTRFISMEYLSIFENLFMKQLPEVKSPVKAVLMNLVIEMGTLNIGYVLTYLTLTIETLFATLGISKEEKTDKLSLINGILPLGCFIGVFIGYFLKRKFTNRQCIFIADAIGMMNSFTLIARIECIVAFRFFLGIANGISSLLMPVYVKSICPERYFVQVSLVLGYGVNTGVMFGQLMGIGYISFNGAGSQWWRVVFIFPSIICATRTLLLLFVFPYDSPEQLIQRGHVSQARDVVEKIYKQEFVEQVMREYEKIANQSNSANQSFLDIFRKQKLVTLQVGILSMLVQIWSGAFAVFYYSAQIFEALAGGDLTLKTIYTICIGIFGFLAQFLTIYFIKILGSKYLLIIGGLLMGSINIAIGVMSENQNEQILFGIFILMVLLLMAFSTTLGPVGWSIVPQVNDSDATFFSMEARWGFQAVLIFLFPYMVKGFGIFGAFVLFGVLDLAFAVYATVCLIDSRGLTNSELVQQYLTKYKVLSQEILQTSER